MESDRQRARLMAIWRRLGEADRHALWRYALFLDASRSEAPPAEVPTIPILTPAPPGETAVAALKRLKRSYPMIEADAGLLDEASRLIMERMFGAPDAEVIGRLEAIFRERWQALTNPPS